MRPITQDESAREIAFWTLHPGVALKPMIEVTPGVYALRTEQMEAIERTVNSRSSWDEWTAANDKWRTHLFDQFTQEELELLSDMGVIS